jgi:hypothetical protein
MPWRESPFLTIAVWPEPSSSVIAAPLAVTFSRLSAVLAYAFSPVIIVAWTSFLGD